MSDRTPPKDESYTYSFNSLCQQSIDSLSILIAEQEKNGFRFIKTPFSNKIDPKVYYKFTFKDV